MMGKMMTDIYDFLKQSSKIEIEFQDKTGKYFCLESRIENLGEDGILITPPKYKYEFYNFSVHQPINIIIQVDDGMYMGESNVLGKQLSEISGVLVSYPYNSQQIQRREYLRIPIELEIEITVFKDMLRNIKESFTVVSRDISGKGFSYIP